MQQYDQISPTGFSTGCLHKAKWSIGNCMNIFREVGADAIELSFLQPKHLFGYMPSDYAIKMREQFTHVFIHAPSKDGIRYGRNDDTKSVLAKLRYLKKRISADGIVFHPDIVDDFEVLAESGLPVLIENMDKRKNFGTVPEQLEKLYNYGFGYCFDAQHAYEQDNEMGLAKDLLSFMGSRMSHMHISGCSAARTHVPAHSAANREAIEKILELRISAPKISEGMVSRKIEEVLRNEMEYLKKF